MTKPLIITICLVCFLGFTGLTIPTMLGTIDGTTEALHPARTSHEDSTEILFNEFHSSHPNLTERTRVYAAFCRWDKAVCADKVTHPGKRKSSTLAPQATLLRLIANHSERADLRKEARELLDRMPTNSP